MANRKKIKKTRKGADYELHFLSSDTKSSKEREDEDELGEKGMFIGKEDVQLIYNALSKYKPPKDEYVLHSLLLESFEEILVVDYGEPYPDAG